MTFRAHPARTLPIALAFLLNVVVGPLAPLTQIASAPVLALSGSSFNVTDANLADDGASETDWCTNGVNVITKDDLATGQTDNSYKGAKENELDPDVEFGSIPNNKVDLQRLYITSETSGSGDLLVYVGWIRNDTTGTGTISFEMNQSDVMLSNGINHERTEGDLLIEFNFQANPGSQGGYDVDLTYRTWDGEAWSDAADLGSLAEGSVNADAITDCRNGNAALGIGQFGEFGLNLTDLIGGQCRAFGSIFAKSRSSEQITSELKEVMAPVPVEFSTCGQITILKHDANGDPLGGATFSVTPNPFTGKDSLEVTDNDDPDDNDADGVIHLSAVEPDEYEVCETEAPAGYILDDTCQTLTVGQNGAAEFGPFVNGLGTIHWLKKDAQSGDKVCCASFTLEGTNGAADGFGPITVVDNGTNDEDADPGELAVSGLKLGTYLITETVPPSGYDLPADADQQVVLDDESVAAGDPFMDPPQADASISKDAVVDPIVAGDHASFDIVVSAGGTGTSEDVMLADDNDTSHTWTITGPDAGDCGTAPVSVAPGATLSCDFGDVANGDSRSVTVTMSSDADDCANGIENTASVSSSNDHDGSNDEDSASITVLCPNPGVTKDAEVSPITFGDDAVFDVTVTAGGSGPAKNVVLTDVNDSGHSWEIGGANKAACGNDLTIEAGDTLTCSWAEIPSGESRSITITMKSGESDCELGIDNTASITADADVDQSNNSDSAHVAVLCPNPGVTKDAVVNQVNAGDPASFDVLVTASGTGSSEKVVLTDDNDTSHAWTITGADAGDCGTAPVTVDPGQTLSCDFGTIPNGESRSITITMTSGAGDCANGIANTASISAAADTDESDNSDSASIAVQCPDIAVDKTGSGTVNATDAIYFEITVSNVGDGDAHGFTFNDTLPDVASGWTLVQPAEDGCALNGLALTCSKDVFAAGGEFTLRVQADSDVADCGDLPNTASAGASNEPRDLLDNNSDSHTIVVECPSLTADKVADADVVSAGQPIGFTISVANSAVAGTGTAYDVQLSDLLPAAAGGTIDWAIDPAYAGPGTCEISGALGSESLSCDFGDMAADSSASVHIVSDTTKADCQLFHNAAVISATNHPELNPSDDTTVQCPGLNITKVADDDSIDAGETASYTIVVWNAGPGTAFDAGWSDDLPAGVSWSIDLVNPDNDDSCISGIDQSGHQSASCDFGDLAASAMPTAPYDENSSGKVIVVSGKTDREDCGELDNTAFASASNADTVQASASIHVNCPTVAIVKSNDQTEPVLPGTVVSYTLNVTIGDSTAS
ncbi:MAG TPA: SpaA isopeptide-forming pilin-related protein, partial [Candidatus Limnocylindria bacterium]|nr:SpaA isopeptide-forming pilin-related protein [Candidatus Limnocylindria bacterium]